MSLVTSETTSEITWDYLWYYLLFIQAVTSASLAWPVLLSSKAKDAVPLSALHFGPGAGVKKEDEQGQEEKGDDEKDKKNDEEEKQDQEEGEDQDEEEVQVKGDEDDNEETAEERKKRKAGELLDQLKRARRTGVVGFLFLFAFYSKLSRGQRSRNTVILWKKYQVMPPSNNQVIWLWKVEVMHK